MSTQSNEEIVDELTEHLKDQLDLQPNLENENYVIEPSAETDNDEVECDSDEDTDSGNEDAENTECLDDIIDESHLKELELSLSSDQIESRKQQVIELKVRGNAEYKQQKYIESIGTYTEALRICPLKYSNERSILYANRAASKLNTERNKSAIEDCTKSIELNDRYVRAYIRRAKLYEAEDKLDESLEDFKKVLEIDPGCVEALQASQRLPPKIAERNEKLKDEMLGKLKDLGNMILKPFGLSTDNFNLQQNPETGGYSVNFNQNKG